MPVMRWARRGAMPRRRNAGRKNAPRGPTRRTESSSAFYPKIIITMT